MAGVGEPEPHPTVACGENYENARIETRPCHQVRGDAVRSQEAIEVPALLHIAPKLRFWCFLSGVRRRRSGQSCRAEHHTRSHCTVASDAASLARSLAETCSASAMTRNTFSPATFAISASLQPRRMSSMNSTGYLSFVSWLLGASGIPSKSDPSPTW